MKRIVIIVLTFALLLCGCAKKNESADIIDNSTTKHPDSELNSTMDSSPTEPTYAQQAMVAVSLPVVNEATITDDGTVICNYAYQNIYLVVQEQQIADAVIIDFLNRQDAHHTAANSISDQALAAYSGGNDQVVYSYESLYSPTRLDYSVLSLYGENAVYLGSASPQLECSAANYNMISGDVLTLGSILYDLDALEKLCDLVIENMALIADESQLYEEYPDIIRQRFSREESYDEDWFFTDTGLSFFFAPYEVAPYVAGVITVEVPYSKLSGIIADEFFPLEEDAAEGDVYAQLLGDVNLDTYSQIAELLLSEEGEHIFLSCDGLVRDVQLEIGVWNEDGTHFVPTCVVFSTYILSPGDGIMVQTDIPDAMPNLRLSYKSGDQTITRFISQSGKDGSILLMDNF